MEAVYPEGLPCPQSHRSYRSHSAIQMPHSAPSIRAIVLSHATTALYNTCASSIVFWIKNRIKKSCIANTTTAGYMTRDPSRKRAHFLTQLRNYRNTSGECITKFLFSALSLVATGQAQRDGSAAMIVPCISARCTLT